MEKPYEQLLKRKKIMSLISRYLMYKPQHQEPPIKFMIARFYNIIKREFGERCSSDTAGNTCGTTLDFEKIIDCVEKECFNYLTDREVNHKKTYKHIKSYQHNGQSHNLLATKTFARAMYFRYMATKENRYKDCLIDCCEYMMQHKCKCCGLYLYGQPLGLTQDEGPTTARAIQVFCYAYQITGNKRYLEEAIQAADAAIGRLKNATFGYLHTLGYDVQTTNIDSSFAYSFALLYSTTKDKKWYNEVLFCIRKAIEMQNQDGMFYYSSVKRSTSFSLYHYMILIALVPAIELCGISDDSITASLKQAVVFGRTLLKESGLITEPDDQQVGAYLRCCTRAALMFTMTGDTQTAEKILSALGLFIADEKVYSSILISGNVTDGKYWYRKERHVIDTYCDLAQIDYIRRIKNAD